jgi:hypothetical protein
MLGNVVGSSRLVGSDPSPMPIRVRTFCGNIEKNPPETFSSYAAANSQTEVAQVSWTPPTQIVRCPRNRGNFIFLVVAMMLVLCKARSPPTRQPERYLISNAPLEQERLLDHATAKWSPCKGRPLWRALAGLIFGCLHLWLGSPWSKHRWLLFGRCGYCRNQLCCKAFDAPRWRARARGAGPCRTVKGAALRSRSCGCGYLGVPGRLCAGYTERRGCDPAWPGDCIAIADPANTKLNGSAGD